MRTIEIIDDMLDKLGQELLAEQISTKQQGRILSRIEKIEKVRQLALLNDQRQIEFATLDFQLTNLISVIDNQPDYRLLLSKAGRISPRIIARGVQLNLLRCTPTKTGDFVLVTNQQIQLN